MAERDHCAIGDDTSLNPLEARILPACKFLGIRATTCDYINDIPARLFTNTHPSADIPILSAVVTYIAPASFQFQDKNIYWAIDFDPMIGEVNILTFNKKDGRPPIHYTYRFYDSPDERRVVRYTESVVIIKVTYWGDPTTRDAMPLMKAPTEMTARRSKVTYWSYLAMRDATPVLTAPIDDDDVQQTTPKRGARKRSRSAASDDPPPYAPL